jgi:hypothetical protein
MDPKKTISDLHSLLNRLSNEVRSLDAVPRTSEDAEALLLELAAATDDRTAHFQRFPRGDNPEVYNNSAECREDWSRVLRRHDEAVAKLAAYGQALALSKKSA